MIMCDFKCPGCGLELIDFMHDPAKPTPACESCGTRTRRDFCGRGKSPSPHILEPYIERRLGPDPVEVTSHAHYNRLLKEGGFTQQDKTYLDEQVKLSREEMKDCPGTA